MRRRSRLFKLIQCKRHSAGYGVHSPFAFNLICDTIHTPHRYYSYDDNRLTIEKANLKNEADIKYAELLFRLTNRFNAKNILEIGSGFGINTLYISAHSKETRVFCIEKDDEKRRIVQNLLKSSNARIHFLNELPTEKNSFDAIIWDMKNYSENLESLLRLIPHIIQKEGFVVVNHINTNNVNKKVWQDLLQTETLTMSFDLRSVGIGFFKSSLPKLNYDISF